MGNGSMSKALVHGFVGGIVMALQAGWIVAQQHPVEAIIIGGLIAVRYVLRL